jgi:hypothetical protein
LGVIDNNLASPNSSDTKSLEHLRAALQSLASKLAGVSIGITDSVSSTSVLAIDSYTNVPEGNQFDFTVSDLWNSPLGAYDGSAYEKILEYVKETAEWNSGSAQEKKEAWEQFLKPILKRHKKRESKM